MLHFLCTFLPYYNPPQQQFKGTGNPALLTIVLQIKLFEMYVFYTAYRKETQAKVTVLIGK